MTLALALLLAASSPSPAEDALQRQLAPCRYAAIAALKGDSAWLSRYFQALRLPRQEENSQRILCMAYFAGSIDGLAIEKARAKSER